MNDQTQTQIKLPNNFYITYFADKHKKIITRKGTWTRPNTETQGRVYMSAKGQLCFVYWDLDAEPNENGLQWRCAKNPMVWKARV